MTTTPDSPLAPAALTRLERSILMAIRQHIRQSGEAPTISEISEAVGINSRGTVHRYVQALISKNCLHREGRGWRGLRLSNAEANLAQVSGSSAEQAMFGNSSLDVATLGDDSLRIPLLGTIAAGVPIEAIPDEEHLDLAPFFIGPDRYALRVSGRSMIEAGILDGDTVIIRKQTTARSGEIVVALIDAQEATLKRLGEYNSKVVELIAENADIPPMRYSANRVAIQGVLIGQLRSY